jgi:hypothetical protein
MGFTGIGFPDDDFWPLMVVAVVGTVNPTTGEVSMFLQTEQPLLSMNVGPQHRTSLFTHYTIISALHWGTPLPIRSRRAFPYRSPGRRMPCSSSTAVCTMVGAVLEREGMRPSRTGSSCASPIAAGVKVSAPRCMPQWE